MTSRIQVIAIISLLLNVIIAGMFVGYILQHDTAPNDISAELEKLSPQSRALYESTLVPAKLQMDKQHAQIDAAKKEALHILKTQPFDHDAYIKQVRHIEDIRLHMKLEMAEAVSILAKQFPAEECDILAEIISQPPFTSQTGNPNKAIASPKVLNH